MMILMDLSILLCKRLSEGILHCLGIHSLDSNAASTFFFSFGRQCFLGNLFQSGEVFRRQLEIEDVDILLGNLSAMGHGSHPMVAIPESEKNG